TPSDWVATVARMAEKPALFAPLSDRDQWTVCSYLIAITPDLQRSMKQRREMQAEQRSTEAAMAGQGKEAALPASIDPSAARASFLKVCSQCHPASEVD